MRRAAFGITLVEVLVGISILATIVVAIGISINTYVDFRSRLLTEAKSTYLAEEAYEVLRAMRDNGWNNISSLPIDTKLSPEITPTTIGVTTTPEVIDSQYTRIFAVRRLYRDGDSDIVASTTPGAVEDPNGRLIEIAVDGPSKTVELSSVLLNVHDI